MALNQASLQSAIFDLLDDPDAQGTPQKAAAAWAGVYDDYARNAADVSQDRVSVTNRLGFQSSLLFNKTTGTPATAALEFQLAFTAYWTGAVFAVGIPPLPGVGCPSIPPAPPWATEFSSIVTAVLPGLAAQLTPIFLDTANQDLQSRAAQFAAAFHAATTTNVLVTITGITIPPPPAPVGLPVVNICTVL